MVRLPAGWQTTSLEREGGSCIAMGCLSPISHPQGLAVQPSEISHVGPRCGRPCMHAICNEGDECVGQVGSLSMSEGHDPKPRWASVFLSLSAMSCCAERKRFLTRSRDLAADASTQSPMTSFQGQAAS